MMRNGFRTDIQARMISRICTDAATLNDADDKISFLKICNGFERGLFLPFPKDFLPFSPFSSKHSSYAEERVMSGWGSL